MLLSGSHGKRLKHRSEKQSRIGKTTSNIWRQTMSNNTSSFQEHLKTKIKEDPDFAKEWEAIQPQLNITRALLDARIKRGLTQKQLALLTGVDQSDISKIERGISNPSIKLLNKLADGLDMRLQIQFIPKDL